MKLLGFLLVGFCAFCTIARGQSSEESSEDDLSDEITEVLLIEDIAINDLDDLDSSSYSAERLERDAAELERRMNPYRRMRSYQHSQAVAVPHIQPAPQRQIRVPHVDNNVCSRVTDRQDVIFAHPNRCDKYIQCVHGNPMVRDCGPGTYWNPPTATCGFWAKSYCALQMNIGTPTQTCACNDYVLPQVPVAPVLPPVKAVQPPAPQPIRPVAPQPPVPQPIRPIDLLRPVPQPIRPIAPLHPVPQPIRPVAPQPPSPQPTRPIAPPSPPRPLPLFPQPITKSPYDWSQYGVQPHREHQGSGSSHHGVRPSKTTTGSQQCNCKCPSSGGSLDYEGLGAEVEKYKKGGD